MPLPLRERLGLGSLVWCLVVTSRDRDESKTAGGRKQQGSQEQSQANLEAER